MEQIHELKQKRTKPSPNSWLPGQLYIHLVNDTGFYFKQIKICMSADDNVPEEALPFAKTMFLNNNSPDMAIEGAPSILKINSHSP